MIAPVTSAGIILSYKCNSRCRHCLYACGSEWSGWIDVDDGRRILEGMIATSGRVRGVHFAGGEAFLDFPRLLKLVEIASSLHIPIDYVETNAGWCLDEQDVRSKLTALRDAGLTCLLISASPFHAEYIPPARTLLGIRIASEVFGPGGVIVWLAEFLRQITSVSERTTIPFEDFVRACGSGAAANAAAYGGAMVPGGRAGIRLKDHMRLYPAERFFGENCKDELLHSGTGHFDLYGNYIPSSCTGIGIKDARDLQSMVSGFNPGDFPLIDALCKQGVQGLMDLAARDYGFRPAVDGYAGKCHLCVDIRRQIAAKTNEFPELAPLDFYRYL